MLERLPLQLTSLYIDQPLETETFRVAVKDGNFGTMNRLYYITNGIKESQDFLELTDHPAYTLSARVGVQCAYIGRAKQQIEILKFMKRYLGVSPRYQMRVRLYRKNGTEAIFSFNHDTRDESKIYTLTNIIEDKIKEII